VSRRDWRADIASGAVAVGTRITARPRTEPYVRLSCIRLHLGWATAKRSRERASPEPRGGIAEVPQRLDIGRRCRVVEVASDDLPQPFPLPADRLVQAPLQFAFDLLELRPQTVATGFPFEQELAAPGLGC
jgi:hypothetical protein